MGGLPPDQVARLLEERVIRLGVEQRSEQAALDVAREQGIPDIFLVETLLRLAMVGAELSFVRTLAYDIRSGALVGTKTWARMHELLASGLTMEDIVAVPVRHLGEEGRILGQLPTMGG